MLPTKEKTSTKLRRRLQDERRHGRGRLRRWWVRFRSLFRREGDPFKGIEKIPTFGVYLNHRRPWDCHPSPHYIEMLERKNYWYNNPPPLAQMLAILFAFVAVNLAVGLISISVNRHVFWELYRDLKRPSYVYEDQENNGMVPYCCWALCHLINGIGPWFVYLTGGWELHQHRMIPYGVALLVESVVLDVMFGWRRIDVACSCLLVVLACMAVSAWMFGRVTVLAALCVAPLWAMITYCFVLTASLWDLNGAVLGRQIDTELRGSRML